MRVEETEDGWNVVRESDAEHGGLVVHCGHCQSYFWYPENSPYHVQMKRAYPSPEGHPLALRVGGCTVCAGTLGLPDIPGEVLVRKGTPPDFPPPLLSVWEKALATPPEQWASSLEGLPPSRERVLEVMADLLTNPEAFRIYVCISQEEGGVTSWPVSSTGSALYAHTTREQAEAFRAHLPDGDSFRVLGFDADLFADWLRFSAGEGVKEVVVDGYALPLAGLLEGTTACWSVPSPPFERPKNHPRSPKKPPRYRRKPR